MLGPQRPGNRGGTRLRSRQIKKKMGACSDRYTFFSSYSRKNKKSNFGLHQCHSLPLFFCATLRFCLLYLRATSRAGFRAVHQSSAIHRRCHICVRMSRATRAAQHHHTRKLIRRKYPVMLFLLYKQSICIHNTGKNKKKLQSPHYQHHLVLAIQLLQYLYHTAVVLSVLLLILAL